MVWEGTQTLQHEGDATPSTELLERVRLLFPYIEDRSAGGDLAASSMTCSETVIREGTALCMGGEVVVTTDKAQFKVERGKLRAIAAPTRRALLQGLQRTARSYWVTAGAVVAIALVGHVLQLYEHVIVWVLGIFAVMIAVWFLSDRVAV